MMTETDFLNDLAQSNPNEPATKGLVLLLRAETKSEFQMLRSNLDQKFGAIDKKFEAIDKKFEAIDKKFEAIDKNFEVLATKMAEMQGSMDLIAQQVAILVQRQA